MDEDNARESPLTQEPKRHDGRLRSERRVRLALSAAVAVLVPLAATTTWLWWDAAGARNARDRAYGALLLELDISEARLLLAQEKTLWPKGDPRDGSLRQWLDTAERLLQRSGSHVAGRNEFAEAATNAAAMEPNSAARLQALEELAGTRTQVESLMPEIRTCLALHELIETGTADFRAATERYADRWADVGRRLSARGSRYPGLSLAPQDGLIPIGPNEHGYEEFAVAGTGAVPVPGNADTAPDRDSRSLDGIVLVLVPGGAFTMGAQRDVVPIRRRDGKPVPDEWRYDEWTFDEQAYDDEAPAHRVRVKPYFLAKTECTVAQWLALTSGTGSAASGRDLGVPVAGTDRSEYRNALWKWSLRLPSEAEWECACRAGSTTRYSSGDRNADLGRVGWYDANSDGRLHTVGEKSANQFGLFDMHGNVFEWCEDAWHDTYDGAPTDGRAWVDEESEFRVIRGGSFDNPSWLARSASRFHLVPGYRWSGVGFRPARSVTTD